MDNQPTLSVTNLEVAYGDRKVLKGVSFEVHPGEVVGLIGRNGAGKTTLLSTIMGLISPLAGDLLLEGAPISYPHDYERVVSIADTGHFYPFWSAKENLEFFSCPRASIDEIAQALEAVDLTADARKKVSTFSLGMVQRLNIARGLLRKPKLLIMDEPLNGVDPMGVSLLRQALADLIERHHTAVLMSSNSLKEMEAFCTRYIFLRDGAIVQRVDDIQTLQQVNAYIELADLTAEERGALLAELNGCALLHAESIERVYCNAQQCADRVDEAYMIAIPAQTTVLEDMYFAMQRSKRARVMISQARQNTKSNAQVGE